MHFTSQFFPRGAETHRNGSRTVTGTILLTPLSDSRNTGKWASLQRCSQTRSQGTARSASTSSSSKTEATTTINMARVTVERQGLIPRAPAAPSPPLLLPCFPALVILPASEELLLIYVQLIHCNIRLQNFELSNANGHKMLFFFPPAVLKPTSVLRLLAKPGRFRTPCIPFPNSEYFYPVSAGPRSQMKGSSERRGLSDTTAAAAPASHSALVYALNFPFGRQKLMAGKRARQGTQKRGGFFPIHGLFCRF